METINSIEKTRITFQFKLRSKTPLLPTYKAKLMQLSSLYTKMLAVIIGVKAARMSVMEKSNEDLVTDVTQWLSQFVGIGLWPTAKTLFPGNPLEPCVTSACKIYHCLNYP